VRQFVIRIFLSLPVGLALSIASAWLPMFALSEVTAVPSCSRAWPVDASRVGVVLDDNFNWWLPVDHQCARVFQGKAVLHAEVDPSAKFDGPRIYFTGGDSWAAPIRLADVHTEPPNWYTQAQARPRDVNWPFAGAERWSAGWPFQCMEGTIVLTDTEKGLMYAELVYMLEISQSPPPCVPIVAALVADTFFWACITTCAFALVHSQFRRLRGFFRDRRGRCFACGYERRGLASVRPCPECGHIAQRLE
jgi:hypothetical protein